MRRVAILFPSNSKQSATSKRGQEGTAGEGSAMEKRRHEFGVAPPLEYEEEFSARF